MLYIDAKTNEFFSDQFFNCCKCSKLIMDRFVLNCQWDNQKSPQFYNVCLICIKGFPRLLKTDERRLIFITNNVTENLQPWLPTPPQLKTGIPDQALNSDGEVIDRTRLAGRPDYKGIDDYNNAKLMMNKREYLDYQPNKLDEFFQDVVDSKLITNEEKKLLAVNENVKTKITLPT